MATFNGEKFISEQLNSILGQTTQNWTLLVRDDGSYDKTVDIVGEYARIDSRIILLKDDYGNIGVNANFSKLLNFASTYIDSQYFCFADQDDVWFPNKLEVMLSELIQVESSKNITIPTLVYSDLEVVDSKLNVINKSFMKYQGIYPPKNHPLGLLIVQNLVTGCACMFNRSLLQMSIPIPDDALVHDWWFALCSAIYGHLIYINQPLVKYRQHPNNQIGAIGVFNRNNPFKGHFYKRILNSKKSFIKMTNQAAALSIQVSNDSDLVEVKKILEDFSKICTFNIFERFYLFFRVGIHRSSKIGTVSLFFRVIFI